MRITSASYSLLEGGRDGTTLYVGRRDRGGRSDVARRRVRGRTHAAPVWLRHALVRRVEGEARPRRLERQRLPGAVLPEGDDDGDGRRRRGRGQGHRRAAAHPTNRPVV